MALPDGTSFTFTQQDKNTTYITGTPDTSGLTKLYQSTGSSTDGTITQAAITSALDSKADTSGTYTGLTVGNANAVDTTYLLDHTYPIGAVYSSLVQTDPSDSTVLGIGTWDYEGSYTLDGDSRIVTESGESILSEDDSSILASGQTKTIYQYSRSS